MLTQLKNVQMIGEHLADPAKSFYSVVYDGPLNDFKEVSYIAAFCDRFKNERLAKDLHDGDHLLMSCTDGTAICKIVVADGVPSLQACTYAPLP